MPVCGFCCGAGKFSMGNEVVKCGEIGISCKLIKWGKIIDKGF